MDLIQLKRTMLKANGTVHKQSLSQLETARIVAQERERQDAERDAAVDHAMMDLALDEMSVCVPVDERDG